MDRTSLGRQHLRLCPALASEAPAPQRPRRISPPRAEDTTAPAWRAASAAQETQLQTCIVSCWFWSVMHLHPRKRKNCNSVNYSRCHNPPLLARSELAYDADTFHFSWYRPPPPPFWLQPLIKSWILHLSKCWSCTHKTRRQQDSTGPSHSRRECQPSWGKCFPLPFENQLWFQRRRSISYQG